MTQNIDHEIASLQAMTGAKLRVRYAEVFGEPTRAGHKTWLVKRIAWRLQALAEGDLSERARQRAHELANDADLRLSPPKVPVAGIRRHHFAFEEIPHVHLNPGQPRQKLYRI